MPGRGYNASSYRYGFNGQEKSDEIKGEGNSYTALFWEYDPRTGQRWNLDPKPVVGISDYSTFEGNPIQNADPNGDCINCAAAGIGAVFGGIIGGAIEAGSQLYKGGKVSNWKAVGGAAVQGAVTGAVAGFTGGGSLLTTTVASGVANGIGGAANNAIQGKKITMKSVAIDVAEGAAFGAAGKLISNKNVLAKSFSPQSGYAMNYTLKEGKVVFQKGIENTGVFDFIIKDGKTMIGQGHYAMANKGKIIAGAGQISLENGIIKQMYQESGHYKPNIDQMKAAKKMLEKAGFKFAKDFKIVPRKG